MQPVKLMIEVQSDLEGIRRFLLGMAPKLEARQPGITAQLQQADLRHPMVMPLRGGDAITVLLDPRGERTAIKVNIQPSMRPRSKWAAGFWHWRNRWLARIVLKRLRPAIERAAKLE
jgi:hypothetical protein